VAPELAMELDRKLQDYIHRFAELQALLRSMVEN
jgi:hypothetical protein